MIGLQMPATTRLATLACALLLGLGVPSVRAQQPPAGTAGGRVLASYDFSTSAQGWRISGDTDPMPPLYHATGGQDGGCIEGVDQALGETWYFNAPADAIAQLPNVFAGTLSYWLRQSGDQISLNDDDIVIIAKTGRISYRFTGSPGTSWTPMTVRFAPGPGWVWNFNKPATEAQMREVLAGAVQFLIRGEYVTGDDHASLDTVVLTAAPGVR